MGQLGDTPLRIPAKGSEAKGNGTQDIDSRKVRKSRAHDIKNFHITLKQWRMLHAVNDCGGYAEAAEYLHISQSTISYTIAKLQEQLGISLLKIEGRKAYITEAGRAMLERSRHLIKDALELEAFAESLREGLGPQIRFVVDHGFPSYLLMLALRRFSWVGGNIRLSLSEVSTPQATNALRVNAADLAITSQVPPGFLGDPLIELEHIAVAHPEHALFRLGRAITAADLVRHVRVIICAAKEPSNSNTPADKYVHHWKVGSVDTAIKALCEGLGYAWLPTCQVRAWLEQGKLKVLPLTEGRTYRTNFYLIRGRQWVHNSGPDRLAQIFQQLATMHSAEHGLQLADDIRLPAA